MTNLKWIPTNVERDMVIQKYDESDWEDVEWDGSRYSRFVDRDYSSKENTLRVNRSFRQYGIQSGSFGEDY